MGRSCEVVLKDGSTRWRKRVQVDGVYRNLTGGSRREVEALARDLKLAHRRSELDLPAGVPAAAKTMTYAVAAGSALKIGLATDIVRRRRELQVGNACSLEVLGIHLRDVETLAHERLRAMGLWLRGEWFDFGSRRPEVVAVLSDMGFFLRPDEASF